jgi:hypothetical protein
MASGHSTDGSLYWATGLHRDGPDLVTTLTYMVPRRRSRALLLMLVVRKTKQGGDAH